jgi:hypothetical protein
MDDWTGYDWHSGKAAQLYVRELRWRQRWALLRALAVPVGIALGLVALWISHRI